MNNRNLKIAVASAAVAFSAAAMADGPDWTFLQGQYGLGDSPSDGENTRYGVAGSAQLFDFAHLGGQFNAGTFDDGSSGPGGIDTDVDVWQINVGGHVGVTDNADLYADVIFGNVDIDDGEDGDYYGAAFGIRAMFTDNVELNGGMEVLQVDDEAFGCGTSPLDDCSDSTETSLFIGGRYGFNENFSFGVMAVDDNIRFGLDDSITFDLRWAFGDQSWLGNN